MSFNGEMVVIWEVSTGSIVKELHPNNETIMDFDLSAQNILCTAGKDEKLRFFDINNNFEEKFSLDVLTYKGKTTKAKFVSFRSDGKQIFAQTQYELIIWDIKVE